MILESIKEQIDAMSYQAMLQLWREAPLGHAMFEGEAGEYYSQVMRRKRDEVGDAAAVAASKSIGWGG